MKLKVIIHEADEGGYWAEVPAIPGCATQGEDLKELIKNICDAVEGCLTIDMNDVSFGFSRFDHGTCRLNEDDKW